VASSYALATGLSKSGADLSGVRPNADADPAQFRFSPPPTAKVYDPPRLNLLRLLPLRNIVQPNLPNAQNDRLATLEQDLIPVGQLVPDFDLPQADGTRIGLYKALKGKKATLVNFWFHGCPPCRRELPELQKLHDELKDKGFQIIAVNRGDSAEVVGKFWAESKFTFPHVLGGTGEDYLKIGKPFGIAAYPTNYLVDSDGRVLWRKVAFDESALREALAKAGIR
jgi:peroxiredoxin